MIAAPGGPYRIDLQNPVADHPLNRGLVSWWLAPPHLAGGGQLWDLCSRNHGTLTNGPAWTAGRDGFGALTFDGADDVVACGNVAPGVTAVTMSFWAYHAAVPTFGTYQHYMLKQGAAGWTSPFAVWAIRTQNDSGTGSQPKLAAWVNDGGVVGNFAYGSTVLTAGIWFHVSTTYDGTTLRIYLNGVQDGSATVGAALSSSSFPLLLGATPTPSDILNGRLADARVYSRALSALEVAALYSQSLRGHPDTLRRYPDRSYSFPEQATPADTSSGGLAPRFSSATGPYRLDLQQPVADHPLNRGLVSWWLAPPHLAGGQRLWDLCNRNHGTLTNGPAWGAGPGGFGALSFDGTNDYVSVPSVSFSGQSFGVALTTRRAASGRFDLYGCCGASTATTRAWVILGYRNSDRFTLDFYGDGLDTASTYTDVDTDVRWHVTFDAATLTQSIYRNGMLENSRTAAGTSTAAGVLEWGRYFADGAVAYLYSQGRISDLRLVLGRCPSAAEVFDLYSQSLRGHPDTLRRYPSRSWFFPAQAASTFQAAWARQSNQFIGTGVLSC